MLQFAIVARKSIDCTTVESMEHAQRIRAALNACYGDDYSYVRHVSELLDYMPDTNICQAEAVSEI